MPKDVDYDEDWLGKITFLHPSESVCKLCYDKFYMYDSISIQKGRWEDLVPPHGSLLYNTLSATSTPVITSLGTSTDGPDITSPPTTTASSTTSEVSAEISTTSSTSSLAVNIPHVQHSLSSSSLPVVSPRSSSSSSLTPLQAPISRQVRSKSVRIRDDHHSSTSLIPYDCLIIAYPSSYSVPKPYRRQLSSVFGKPLLHKIDRHIRDAFNGEQAPGTAFLIDTPHPTCRHIICVSTIRSGSYVPEDWPYNAFRSALQAIHSYNKGSEHIRNVLCPIFEIPVVEAPLPSVATTPAPRKTSHNKVQVTTHPFVKTGRSAVPDAIMKTVQQMKTCYEYWDWSYYAPGTVPPVPADVREAVAKAISYVPPQGSTITKAYLEDLILSSQIAVRGFVYEEEVIQTVSWLEPSTSDVATAHSNDLRAMCAYALASVLRNPPLSLFALPTNDICAAITPAAIDLLLNMAVSGTISLHTEIDPSKITTDTTLGKGASAKVQSGSWDGKRVAVKKFTTSDPLAARHELTINSLLRHSRLLHCYGGYISPNEQFLVAELMDFNLCDLLYKNPEKPLAEAEAKHIDYPTILKLAIDIAEAMAFLHARGVIHRDLKPMNVLCSKKSGQLTAYVADFGTSRVVDTHSKMTGNVGTPAWIAPEVLQNKKYTEKADVYSFAMILYELVTSRPPFSELQVFSIPVAVTKGDRPVITAEDAQLAPKAFFVLIKTCWKQTASKRPTFPEILISLKSLLPPEPLSHTPTPSPPTVALSSSPTNSFILSNNYNNNNNNNNNHNTHGSDEGVDSTQILIDQTPASDPGVVQCNTEQEYKIFTELKKRWYSKKHKMVLGEDTLMKALRTHQYSISQAKQLLRNYSSWYQSYNKGQAITIDLVRPFLEQEIVFVPHAVDLALRPIWIMRWNKYFPGKTFPITDFLRTQVYCLERITESAAAQKEGITVLMDLHGWQMANFNHKFASLLLGIFKNEFPVVVQQFLLLDPPNWIGKVVAICQPFMGPKLAAKIKFTARGRDLLQYIGKSNLLPDMGGTLQFEISEWIKKRYEIERIPYISSRA